MPDISIKISEKVAQVQGSPQIVCGNSDYAVTFDLDSEWDNYDRKTMHAVWMDVRTGELKHYDVEFSGSTAMLPALYHCDRVCIGIYAGDIRTTTPACVPCARCITDGEPYHDDPPPDVYRQLIEYMEEIIEGGGGSTSEVYPETLCFLSNSVPIEPEILDLNDADWEPAGNVCMTQGSHSSGTASFTMTFAVPTLVVMVLACRYVDSLGEYLGYPDDWYEDRDGWALDYETTHMTYENEDKVHMGIRVFSKQYDAGTHTINASFWKYDEEGRVISWSGAVNIYGFYNADSVSVGGESLISDKYNPPAANGKQRVYLVYHDQLISNSKWNPENYSAEDGLSYLSQISGNGILYSWYDYHPEAAQSPTFKYDGDEDPDTDSALGLTISINW